MTSSKWDSKQIIRKLGDGTFGRALLVEDQDTRRRYAMKVIRPVSRYIKSAKIETEILEDVNDSSSPSASLCVRLYESFSFRNKRQDKFYAMVFERCGMSLYDFVKSNNYRGFSLPLIKKMGYRLLKAVEFLHEEKHLVHTDLKVRL